MFIAALFIIGRAWNLSRYPSTDEWLMKVLYLTTVYFYLVINKNEIMKSGGWYDGSECNLDGLIWFLEST